MNAANVLFGAAYLALVGLVIRWLLRRLPGGRDHRPQLPYRSRADVLADVDINRDCRRLRQAIDDHDAVWVIWPDPPSTRVIEAQHRLDTAKQRKEEGQ